MWRKSGDTQFIIQQSTTECDTITITSIDSTEIIRLQKQIDSLEANPQVIEIEKIIETVRYDTISDQECLDNLILARDSITAYRDSLINCLSLPPSLQVEPTDCAVIQIDGVTFCRAYVSPTPVNSGETASLTVNTSLTGTNGTVIVRDVNSVVLETINIGDVNGFLILFL